MPTEIYISNISEDVWSFIQSMHEKERAIEIEENAYLSDREIVSQPEHTRNIVILPVSLDSDFLAYFQNLYPNVSIEILTPKIHTGEICKDIQRDKKLMDKLLTISKENPVIINSYSSSAQFYELITVLREQGGNITTSQSPETENSWIINFYGSKSGIRQTTDQLGTTKKPWMSKGYISHNMSETAALAANIYCRDQAVVLKTNKAHAGAGVKIFRKGDLSFEYE